MIVYKSVMDNDSAGGGHTIEDSEGTDLTQRDTLQFGEGFLAEDDDTNEKTVISLNRTILSQTLTAGNTSVTFTNLPTTGDNLIDFFTSTGINYTDINVSTAGQVTLTFDAQIVDVVVYCKVEEV